MRDTPAFISERPSASDELQMRIVRQMLRKRYRSGWLLRGVPRQFCETVDDHTTHTHRAAVCIAPHHPELDQAAVIQMAEVHDFAEAIAPDFTPHDGISPVKKHAIEVVALQKVVAGFSDAVAMSITQLWNRYEQQACPESQLVYQLDKMDAAVRALDYERDGYAVGEFFPYTRGKLSDPLLAQTFDVLIRREFAGRVRAHVRYFTLLTVGGDEAAFRDVGGCHQLAVRLI